MGPNPALLPGQQIQQQMQQQQQLYDQPNCGGAEYDAVGGPGQNFGNPYDCPEGAYGGSMVSSVGYSKVSDHMQPQFQGPAMAAQMPPQPPMPPQHAMGPGQKYLV